MHLLTSLCTLSAVLLVGSQQGCRSQQKESEQQSQLELNGVFARIFAKDAGQAPVELKGSRNEKSHPFFLIAGTYMVSWRAHTDDGPGDCTFYGHVNSTDGNYQSAAGDATVHTAGNGSTYLYNVPDGKFYFEGISGCAWSITITRK